MDNLGTPSHPDMTGKRSTVRQKNFTNEEDLLLCSAWSNTTTDGAVGIGQSRDTFWSRAHVYWLEHKKDTDPDRTPDGLSQRFSRIKTAVSKFVSCLTQVQTLSGYSDSDKVLKAKEMYKQLELKSDEGKKTPSKNADFVFEHCWNELKNDQKWLGESTIKKSVNCEVSNNRSTPIDINGDGEDASSTPLEVERPIGKKLAKEGRTKRKGKFMYDSSPVLDKIGETFSHGDKQHDDNISMYLESEKKMDILLDMKKKRLDMEEKKFAMDKEMFSMDMALKEAEFMKVDLSTLTDQDQIDFYRTMKRNIKAKYEARD